MENKKPGFREAENSSIELTVTELQSAQHESAETAEQTIESETQIAEPAVTNNVLLADQLLGKTIAKKYRLDSLIGTGSTSNVYAGQDIRSGSPVAIKVLHSHLVSDSGVVERFLQEAKTATILVHPNITRVADSGLAENGQPFIAMELVRGKSLQEFLRERGGSLKWQEALDISIQLCAALKAAHEKDVVHRDLKPTNIVIASDSDKRTVKVLDFGIAKVLHADGQTFFRRTQSGETQGSLLYMSPEQCLDHEIDASSDLYSLGCVMYELLTGKPPLCGRTAFVTMNHHLTTTPEPFAKVHPGMQFPAALERVIFRSMAKAPKERECVSRLQDDLMAIRDGLPVQVDEKYALTETTDVQQLLTSPTPAAILIEKPRDIRLAVKIFWTCLIIDSVFMIGTLAIMPFMIHSIHDSFINLKVLIPSIVAMMATMVGFQYLFISKISAGRNWARLVYSGGIIVYWLTFIAQNMWLFSQPHDLQTLCVAAILALRVMIQYFAVFLIFSKSSEQWFAQYKKPPAQLTQVEEAVAQLIKALGE